MAFGRTVKKKFFAALFAGFLVLGGMVAAFGLTGTAFALPLGGMGDFYVKFDKLEGKGFKLNPNIGETGDSNAAPLVRNRIDSATIHGLVIYKDLKLPGGKWVRINITSSQPTKLEGLIQDARFIDANLKFNNGLAIEQHNTSGMSAEEAFKKNWDQNADRITITDGKIVTDYLFQNMVSLQRAKISIDEIDKPDLTGTGNDSNVAAVGGGDGGSGFGGMLPTTASHYLLMISIGALTAAVGALFVFRKKLFSRLRNDS